MLFFDFFNLDLVNDLACSLLGGTTGNVSVNEGIDGVAGDAEQLLILGDGMLPVLYVLET